MSKKHATLRCGPLVNQDGAISFCVRATFGSPLGETWPLFTDPQVMADWSKSKIVLNNEGADGTSFGVGASRTVALLATGVRGSVKETVVEANPPSAHGRDASLVYDVAGAIRVFGLFRIDIVAQGRVELVARDDGSTDIEWHVAIRKSPWPLVSRALADQLRSRLAQRLSPIASLTVRNTSPTRLG